MKKLSQFMQLVAHTRKLNTENEKSITVYAIGSEHDKAFKKKTKKVSHFMQLGANTIKLLIQKKKKVSQFMQLGANTIKPLKRKRKKYHSLCNWEQTR
jgi:hypothetical protein